MKWLIFYFLTISIIVDGQVSTSNYSESAMITELRQSEFSTFQSIENVPKDFWKQLNGKSKLKLRMVNPGQEYNKTDMVGKDDFRSELVLVGISQDKLYILIYNLGGYGVSRRAFLFKKQEKEFFIRDYTLSPLINSVEDAKGYIKSNSE